MSDRASRTWKEQRKRNPIAADLRTPKYGPRIKQTKRQHLVDEVHRREADEEYWFWKELGLGSK